ncbi:hypothetical protein LTR93_007000 [Exophiala xenobiotica]|nr:hypothetical protein LTR93_007000 [Exophiala xenobiotica]
MVSTRSRTSGDIKEQVAAIDEACASTSTKQTTITSFFLSSVKRTNDAVTETTTTETTTLSGVVVTEAPTSRTSNAPSEPTNPASSSEENPAEHQPTEAPTKGRAKKRKAADAVTKKFKTSKAKVVKVKKEGNDDFQPPVIAASDDQVSSDRRVLRQRGSNGKVSAEPKEINAATQSPPSCIVVLKINAERFNAFLNRASSPKKKRTIFRRSRSNPYSNKYRFEFGEDRLPNHSEPTPQSLKEVAEILEKERMTLTNGALVTAEAFTPFHGGSRLTVDALVRVIIAQACTNEVATEVQQTMRLAYPYHVNGRKVVGEKPNYHDVRTGTVKKLENVIKKGGLIFKAQKIKDCLDAVFDKNVALLQPGEVEYTLNQPTASDFVPGLLSMEYIYTIYKEGGKQAAFDSLVELPLMGVKSVPEDCSNENNMCSHLDSIMPDNEQKLHLHQDFWRHRRTCVRCSGRIKQGGWAWENSSCVLEHLIKRPVAKKAAADDGKETTVKKPQAAPKKTTPKKEPTEEAQLAKGLIKMEYMLDDDFDAVEGGTGVMRTVWVKDYSMMDNGIVAKVEVSVECCSGCIEEEIVISAKF